MIDVVYERVEGVGATFCPFAALCCVAEMAPGVDAFLWGEAKGNNLTFFLYGVEKLNVSLDNVFGEEMASENILFVFV